jgi:hypothetical protein
MPWLTVRYTPGFQEDLTTWELHVTEDGRVDQTVDVCRFSPSENFKESHSLCLSSEQLNELKVRLAATDFDEVNKEESLHVVDDSEEIHIKVQAYGSAKECRSHLDLWLWRQSQGEAIPTSIEAVLALWQHVRLFSQYKARLAQNA